MSSHQPQLLHSEHVDALCIIKLRTINVLPPSSTHHKQAWVQNQDWAEQEEGQQVVALAHHWESYT
jgi:hypothetical protein